MDPSKFGAVPLDVSQTLTGAAPGVRSTDEVIERGRGLAEMAVEELIEEVRRRATAHQLDRGLRLSLPYFDDRRLVLRRRDFTVIPRGRVLFVPAFVVIAVEREATRVALDAQYTESTRRHLLGLLRRLRAAFGAARDEKEDRYTS